jgi:large subunit ribosomal protein L5
MSSLRLNYQKKILPNLQKELGVKNMHATPNLEKVVVSVGLGRVASDTRYMETAINTLRKITSQQPVVTTAKKSIANFKLREGAKIGLKVTLRGDRMLEFVEKLIRITLPRVRDFKGVSGKSFDKNGNFSLGLPDQTVFAELSYDETTILHGLQITFHISNSDSTNSRIFLERLGFKFTQDVKNG